MVLAPPTPKEPLKHQDLQGKQEEVHGQAFVHLSLPEVFCFFVEHSTFWFGPEQLL